MSCEKHGAVAVVMYNRPKRANAWSQEMVNSLEKVLDQVAADDSAIVLTGNGKYFCSGADFGGLMTPMLPSTLVKTVEEFCRGVFENFLTFPKPVICCVNGPAIGGAVTSASLCDVVLASDSATLRTPFKELGIQPEGCSTYTWERWYGREFWDLLIEQGGTCNADVAKSYGFVDEIVSGGSDALLERGIAVANEWIGCTRKIHKEKGLLDKLRDVNIKESKDLSEAVLSSNFLRCQCDLMTKKKKPGPAWLFWVLLWTRPVWSML